MRFDAEEFRKRAKEDFEGAWHDGVRVLSTPPVSRQYPRYTYRRARPHPVYDTIQRLRQAYLAMGFDEAMNPVIVEEQEVYRQFGPEAMAVLDRVFYLGGLPRPNVGIARKQIEGIESIIGSTVSKETEDALRNTLHAYKKGDVDGDDLTHALSLVLDIDDAMVVHILDAVFPEFRELAPECSRSTLRSHMTSGWFMSLGESADRLPHPIRLFSIDRCFRREQEEGPTRLMSYHSASCIVAGEEVTLDEGMAVAEGLLSAFGFTDFEFRPDEKRSKYYMPGTQTEVYARHPVHDWVEVATFGIYSPSALGEYGVGVPVMNLGLGVERLAMIIHHADDVRKLSYGQFYPPGLTDHDLARFVRVREEPVTETGRVLAKTIAAVATAHAADPSPCSFPVWSGEISGTAIDVSVTEPEENSRLLGPACGNEIFIHDGAILGVPDTEKFASVRANGIATGIRFVDSVSLLAAARIEEAARCGEGTTVQVKMAKLPSDVNIRIEEHAMRYVTDNQKKIDLRGPIFMTVESRVVAE
ncbi:MAG: O-phosphoserine--tRNA ligase [Methanocalculus sp. MSAO_Arc1]|uniref:O-phosphoserine--tRNA ligase n=1 Tax=Methanocalculus TaxID=71151 RepID=UPI000FF7E8BE|nr:MULTISPECIES: O-phosphoserine--tRNA ligase [unclassified Methanocalculus]MCP1662657.1 O-phosphoseryl-tRNA synthetase [Methanocalculus sp. AMF5]RQD80312.1 MAG: O-phosphoserine--tRNA ligase [Methanocalculus sp. MSAO_Arc1]